VSQSVSQPVAMRGKLDAVEAMAVAVALQPAISPTQSEERASKNGSQENFKLRF